MMASHHPAPASATPAPRALGVLELHSAPSPGGPGAAEVGARVGPWVWSHRKGGQSLLLASAGGSRTKVLDGLRTAPSYTPSLGTG